MQHKAVYLIASLSGRALARSAARADFPCVGIDAFADRDTCAMTLDWAQMPLLGSGKIEPASLEETADRLCTAKRCLGLIYGSGFEARLDLLGRLARSRHLLGNTPEVLDKVGSPDSFFALLMRLGIPFPAISFTAPVNASGWLVKSSHSCGGTHVRKARRDAPLQAGDYFQRQVHGQEWSLLFLADGKDMIPVGFNRPMPTPEQAPDAWCYAGSVRQPFGPPEVTHEVLHAAEALTRKLGLKGLNGLDFIVTDSGWVLLELNARPTATLELWDTQPLPPLLGLHVQACSGSLPDFLPQPEGSKAIAVVYADRALRIPQNHQWESWCADLPRAGSVIGASEPVCTVRAHGIDAATASQDALARSAQVLARLARAQTPPLNARAGLFDQPAAACMQ